jgi:hypothetical protein
MPIATRHPRRRAAPGLGAATLQAVQQTAMLPALGRLDAAPLVVSPAATAARIAADRVPGARSCRRPVSTPRPDAATTMGENAR